MKQEIKDGGPAFPVPGTSAQDMEGRIGMTLRDWFAGMALPSIISQSSEVSTKSFGGLDPVKVMAVAAYTFADAMLKAREQ